MSAVLDLSDLAAQANRELEGATALEIMTLGARGVRRRLVVTSSMVDTVMIHLAEQVAPGIDVIFLDTGYHFVETIGTRDAVKLVHNVNVINVTPEQTVRRAGRDLGQGPVRPRSRPVLRAAQGRAAGRGPGAVRGLGERRAPGRLAGPGQHAGRVLGREAQADQDRAASRPGPTTTSPPTSSTTR